MISGEQMQDLVGQESEASSWHQVTQAQVNRFADATHDHQFIHVDADKAARTGFGGTVAHGYYLLSLLPYLLGENSRLPAEPGIRINYGSDKVRFLTPVRVGSYVRARQKIISVREKAPGVWRVKVAAKLELRGEAKPAMLAELIVLILADQTLLPGSAAGIVRP